MPAVALALALACATMACTTENELRHLSTLRAQTNGVALSEDGQEGYAAMSGTTCTIDAQWGCAIADADLPTAVETVFDHVGEVTLGASTQGLHRVTPDGWQPDLDVPIHSVHTARLTDAGAVAIWGSARDGCFAQSEGGSASSVPSALCDDGVQVAVDRRRGSLFAATGDGVFEVDGDRVTRLAGGADLVAFDPRLERLYVARRGTTALRALDRAGRELWAEATDGEIRSLAVRGRHGQLLVLARGDGSQGGAALGRVDRLDGESGDVLGSSQIPLGEAELLVSEDGLTVAVVADATVHFYALEVGDEEIRAGAVERDPPTCIQPTRQTVD